MDWQLFPGWQAGNPGLLPAVRSQFIYRDGDARATGWLLLTDREPVTGWPGALAAQGPALLGGLTWLTGVTFTAVCYQAYLDGAGCGWHHDRDWGAQAILSLGVTRSFALRRAGEIDQVRLAHGDLLFMPPGFQEEWEHCVPEEDVPGERCSLVFRATR